MKKLFKFALAFIATMAMLVVPTSCGDDDDDVDGEEIYNISGKLFILWDESYSFDFFQFNNDGTLEYGYYSYRYDDDDAYSYLHNGTYSVDKNEIIIKNSEYGWVELGKVSKFEGKLVFWEGYEEGYVESEKSIKQLLEEIKENGSSK